MKISFGKRLYGRNKRKRKTRKKNFNRCIRILEKSKEEE